MPKCTHTHLNKLISHNSFVSGHVTIWPYIWPYDLHMLQQFRRQLCSHPGVTRSQGEIWVKVTKGLGFYGLYSGDPVNPTLNFLSADNVLRSKNLALHSCSSRYTSAYIKQPGLCGHQSIGIMLFYDICAITTLCVGMDWFCTAAVPVVYPNHCSCYGELWVCILDKLSPYYPSRGAVGQLLFTQCDKMHSLVQPYMLKSCL